MSWHHEDYIDLFSALGGVISAAIAAYAAFQSRKSAKTSLQQQQESARFEKERHLLEILKSDANKANESVRNIAGKDWTFFQAANVTYAIDSAKQRIKEVSEDYSPQELEKFKGFFKDQLSHEVTSEMNEATSMPDALFKPNKGIRESQEMAALWLNNVKFFDYMHVYDEDLEN